MFELKLSGKQNRLYPKISYLSPLPLFGKLVWQNFGPQDSGTGQGYPLSLHKSQISLFSSPQILKYK